MNGLTLEVSEKYKEIGTCGYEQTIWRVSDRDERLVTVAAEILATPC
jgi:hypothetical protein